jgi:hypothetical protein
MASKKIRAIKIDLMQNAEGEYVTSVSVASPDALVVISELAMPTNDQIVALAIIIEDEDE